MSLYGDKFCNPPESPLLEGFGRSRLDSLGISGGSEKLKPSRGKKKKKKKKKPPSSNVFTFHLLFFVGAQSALDF